MTTTNQTADQRYQEQKIEMAELLKKFQAKLKLHAKDQAKRPSGWDHVGDMGHYLQTMKELLGEA